MKHEEILLKFDLAEEPNESNVICIKFSGGGEMEFKSYHGFTAIDIYNLLFPTEAKGEINE